MFDHAFTLVARTAAPQPGLSSTMAALLIVLLVLLILSLLLVAVLLVMRQKRRARKASLLPTHHHESKRGSMSSLSSSHRRVMVRPSESVYVYQEKQHLFSADAPPDSPIPEIRITFPEEVDDDGKRKSGRVVVVRVSDSGIGLEPVEILPAYEQNGERFHSIDLERVGGLVEKARNPPQ